MEMMSKKMVQCCLAAWLGLLANGALAASAGNHYVTVSSDTAGVEAIVPVVQQHLFLKAFARKAFHQAVQLQPEGEPALEAVHQNLPMRR